MAAGKHARCNEETTKAFEEIEGATSSLAPILTIMAIIAAYFDESGKKHDHPVVTFCGVAAATSKVGHFENEWEGLLHYYGLNELHMSEAANHTKNLSAKLPQQTVLERIEALKPFADCINAYLEVGLIQAWDVAGFNNLSKKAKTGLGDPNDPYYTAFARGLIELVDYAKEEDRISLICDDDIETAWNCYQHYRGIRNAHEEIREKTVSLAFADSETFPALQAADMSAWLTRREARFQFYGDAFPLQDLFTYLVIPQKPGGMNWMKMFATKEVIKNLSDANWGEK